MLFCDINRVGLIIVLDAILAGRQLFTVFFMGIGWQITENNLFSNIHFAQLMNRNFAILGSRLYLKHEWNNRFITEKCPPNCTEVDKNKNDAAKNYAYTYMYYIAVLEKHGVMAHWLYFLMTNFYAVQYG